MPIKELRKKAQPPQHMHVAQAAHIISTYSADNFGVCSALYELGGMVVIHDPSGCNSTYTTHDEPRWFTKPSLFYISALTEQDAIIGNDQRIIDDVVDAALRQQPRFICLIPSQIAFLIGTDMRALCRIIQKRTGIRTFTLPTSSMTYYERGINLTLGYLAQWLVDDGPAMPPEPSQDVVNLLGVTPLDYSMNGSLASMREYFAAHGKHAISWTLDTTWESIALHSLSASENIVCSYGGLAAAHIMQASGGIPYRVGVPIGGKFRDISAAMSETLPEMSDESVRPSYIIGESVYAQSLALALAAAGCGHFRTIIPVETEAEIVLPDSILATDERDLEPLLETADVVIADPLYEPIATGCQHFVPLPHEGFSGRLYRPLIPNLLDKAGFESFRQRVRPTH